MSEVGAGGSQHMFSSPKAVCNSTKADCAFEDDVGRD